MTVESCWEDANEAFEAGDLQDCLNALAGGFALNAATENLYVLAGKALRAADGTQEAALFEAACANFLSDSPFYDLGYHYMETGHFALARAFLARAYLLNASDLETAYEYALALASSQEFDAAIGVLESSEYRSDFWTSYLLYVLLVLRNRELETAKSFVRFIREQIYGQAAQTPDDAFALQKLNELQNMIRRVESVGSPVENSIRDWHFVQYGSLLLSRLDSTVYVAGGRFRILFPELKEVQAVMLKLRACLDGLGFVPKQILYGASQSSEVLCEVIGGMYNLPTLALTEERYKRYDSLVVVSEAEELSDFYFLAEAKPGKVLFAYNLNWTQETLLTPDIVGVMSESCRFEWQGGSMKVVDFEKGIFERVGTDTRPAPNIAADIVNEGASIEAEFAEDLAFFVKQKAHWQANIHSTRTTFKPESPVKSKES